jgi:glutaryl-CoA dehydrogenase
MGLTGVDFLRLNPEFTESEILFRESTRKFVDSKILPNIKDYFDKAIFPVELIRELGEHGLFGMLLPEEYGGLDASYTTYGLVCQELERGDSGVRSAVSVQSSLVMFPIYTFGSEEQRRQWLPKLAKGSAIGCFGLTEPDFGSNPSGMRTRATKRGEDIVLNGTKRWITNANIADISVVWATDDAGEIGAYLVEKGAKGLTQREIKDKFSLRASHTGELILEDCVIPASSRLPHTSGIKSALQCLDSARFGIIWGVLGAAIACYECVRDYASERVQFSKPLAGYQLVQAKLVWMLTEITKGQLLARRIGELRDQKKSHHSYTSMGKMNNCQIALECARIGRDILGANGITTDYPVIRHMLNLESVKTYEGTDDIHRLILGKEITGLAAFD